MRTTITLPDRLLASAKKRARERETTLSAVIADALRLALARPDDATKHAEHFTLVTFRGDGVLPGVDLDRTSELLTLEDAEILRVSDRQPRRGARAKATRSRRKR